MDLVLTWRGRMLPSSNGSNISYLALDSNIKRQPEAWNTSSLDR
jgi:hypothetical protein